MTGAALTLVGGSLANAPRTDVWEAADWKQLWKTVCDKVTRWRTLAVIPADPDISAELSLQFAMALAYAGHLHLGEHIDVANATKIELSQVADFSRELDSYLRHRNRVVVALAAFRNNAASLELARAADTSMLCVQLGVVSAPAARETVSQLGASQFVGVAMFRLPPSAAMR